MVVFIKKKSLNKKLGIGSNFNKKETYNTRSLVLLAFFTVCFVGLLTRIGYIQFVNGADYKTKAYKQQTVSQTLTSRRGTIFDAYGKILAISSAVDTISINNGQVFYKDGTAVPNEVLAEGISQIFSLDYTEFLEKLNSDTSLINVAKKVEKTYVDTLTAWMEEKEIASGINIDDDYKRTYPYNNLASNVIGFCGNDNQGLEGIESEWENELRGTPGRIITSTNVNKQAISDENEQYIPAQNGSDLYLTIDSYVQGICEKYISQAVIDTKSENGCVIVMRPSTGDILAEVSYPTYDLNAPFSPNTDELKAKWDTLSEQEQSNALIKMWRNKPVTDGYEPGSTFKLITASIGLEENIVEPYTPGDFHCNKTYYVNGIPINCWAANAHGSLTLCNALEKSCNPSFIQLGQRIGKELFYKYLQAYGLLGKTGVRQPGEASGHFHEYDNCKELELATMSFGQRITITPLQLISGISACVNGGDLMQPRIVSKMVNTDTGVETEIPPVKIRQVISKSTSDTIKTMMESVVIKGTGGRSKVTGYSIGGKSGTSEPQPGREEIDGYTASFVAISPTENPEVIVLIILYHPNPNGGPHQGGELCAPIASQILSDILPHLGVTSTATSDNSIKLNTLPDVSGLTLLQARNKLEPLGFTVMSNSSAISTSNIVVSQNPKAGTSLQTGSVICLYAEGSSPAQKQVPDLKGKTAEQAKNSLLSVNLNISVQGSGKVVSQDILAGTSIAEGSVVNVILQEEISGGAQ